MNKFSEARCENQFHKPCKSMQLTEIVIEHDFQRMSQREFGDIRHTWKGPKSEVPRGEQDGQSHIQI